MCYHCWQDYGSPTALPDNGAELASLIAELYDQEDGGTGGPLHVLLDDYNLEYVEPYMPETYSETTQRLTEAIAAGMRPLTVPQRGAVIALYEKWFTLSA